MQIVEKLFYFIVLQISIFLHIYFTVFHILLRQNDCVYGKENTIFASLLLLIILYCMWWNSFPIFTKSPTAKSSRGSNATSYLRIIKTKRFFRENGWVHIFLRHYKAMIIITLCLGKILTTVYILFGFKTSQS